MTKLFGKGIFERTLSDLTNALEHSVFAEVLTRQPGMLQALDPRMKILSILALLLSVGLSRSIPVLLALYVFTLFLAAVSSIPMMFFIRRVWLFMPFFTGLIALPALFITPGPVLLTLPAGLAITQTGLQTVLFLLLRVGTSVSLGILLILTTSWPTLMKAFAVLKVPDGFLLILGMTYRYIYLLLLTAEDMFLSRRSRIVGRLDSAQERQVIVATAGTLMNKSLALSENVYLAMQSRGYRGQPRTLAVFRITTTDWLIGIGMFLVALTAAWAGR